MRKTICLFLLLIALLPLHGQIAVESFRLLESDLTALTQGTQETDQNGDVAALIKVVTTQQGFTFDNGIIGIVKAVQKPAEIWVYVPAKTMKLSIAHPDLGMLRDYYFKIPIEGGRTYELVLTTGEVITTVKKARTTQYLTIRVSPPNAILYVDDELQTLSAEGTFFKLMPLGKHSYRVQAEGYKKTAGVVELTTAEKADVKVELQSLKGTLTITCPDKEAYIVLNEEVVGRDSWTGTLIPGIYSLEARHEGHRTVSEEITIGELEKKEITLSAPTPITGSLRIETEPMGAKVFIDDKPYDETPCVLEGLLIGSHTVKISKEGYSNFGKEIVIKENEETVLSDITLEKNVEPENDTPLQVAEVMPEFPGGIQALIQYLSNNIKYPVKCQENGIQGRVIVSFIVERDGSISNMKVIKSIHPELDKEAIRVVSTMPKWKPGTQRGKAVRVSYNLPINFTLSK